MQPQIMAMGILETCRTLVHQPQMRQRTKNKQKRHTATVASRINLNRTLGLKNMVEVRPQPADLFLKSIVPCVNVLLVKPIFVFVKMRVFVV